MRSRDVLADKRSSPKAAAASKSAGRRHKPNQRKRGNVVVRAVAGTVWLFWRILGRCPAGFLCPTEGTVEPTSCPKGHACPEGSSVALPCIGGTWSNQTGLESKEGCKDSSASHDSIPIHEIWWHHQI